MIYYAKIDNFYAPLLFHRQPKNPRFIRYQNLNEFLYSQQQFNIAYSFDLFQDEQSLGYLKSVLRYITGTELKKDISKEELFNRLNFYVDRNKEALKLINEWKSNLKIEILDGNPSEEIYYTLLGYMNYPIKNNRDDLVFSIEGCIYKVKGVEEKHYELYKDLIQKG